MMSLGSRRLNGRKSSIWSAVTVLSPSRAESQECMAAKLGSQAVAVRAGIEREQLETGVQSYAALRPTRRVTMRVKVKDRRETVNPLNIVAEAEVVVKKREILGHCLNCDFWDLGRWAVICVVRRLGGGGWGCCLDWGLSGLLFARCQVFKG